MTMTTAEVGTRFTAADRVWIAVALLHRENPSRDDFSLREILERGQREGIVELKVNTFKVHANQHCVANRLPNPGNHRMLFETGESRRRLYRPGDMCRPGRTGKITPNPDEIPSRYRPLLAWYAKWSGGSSSHLATPAINMDPLLRLIGSGRELWKDEHADEYVRRLREGWE